MGGISITSMPQWKYWVKTSPPIWKNKSKIDDLLVAMISIPSFIKIYQAVPESHFHHSGYLGYQIQMILAIWSTNWHWLKHDLSHFLEWFTATFGFYLGHIANMYGTVCCFIPTSFYVFIQNWAWSWYYTIRLNWPGMQINFKDH